MVRVCCQVQRGLFFDKDDRIAATAKAEPVERSKNNLPCFGDRRLETGDWEESVSIGNGKQTT